MKTKITFFHFKRRLTILPCGFSRSINKLFVLYLQTFSLKLLIIKKRFADFIVNTYYKYALICLLGMWWRRIRPEQKEFDTLAGDRRQKNVDRIVGRVEEGWRRRQTFEEFFSKNSTRQHRKQRRK